MVGRESNSGMSYLDVNFGCETDTLQKLIDLSCGAGDCPEEGLLLVHRSNAGSHDGRIYSREWEVFLKVGIGGMDGWED